MRPQAEQAETGDGDGDGEPVVLDTRSLWTAIGTLAFSLPALGVPHASSLSVVLSRDCVVRGWRSTMDVHSTGDHADMLAVCSLQWAPDGEVVRTNVARNCSGDATHWSLVLAQVYN